MGYYSRVAIAMENKEAAGMLKAFAIEFPENDLFDKEYSLTNYHVGREFTLFYWDEIKWYTGAYGFPECDWVENYLRSLEESPNPHYFIRLGEEWEDIYEFWNEAESDSFAIHENVVRPYRCIDFCYVP
jgi:hypothetical protein